MNDLLAVLRTAKQHYCFSNMDDFDSFVHTLRHDSPGINVIWDNGAGEDWARGYDSEISFMIHRAIGIAFVRSETDSFRIPTPISKLTVVPVSSFDSTEWFLDIDLLLESFPELCWHTSPDIVNPSAFSLNDLYYATV